MAKHRIRVRPYIQKPIQAKPISLGAQPVMFDYSFADLTIGSNAPVDGLRRRHGPASSAPDIHLEVILSAPPEPGKHHYAWPGRYGLALGEWNDKWLMTSRIGSTMAIAREGGRITIFAEEATLSQGTLDVLIRRVLPRVAILFGATAVHSATLAGPSGAIMLLGSSGAGKSTMTAALAHHLNWQIYSDDISILWDRTLPTLASAASGVCVWPDSASALGLAMDQCFDMPGYDGKLRYVPSTNAEGGCAPLIGFVFLNRMAHCDTPHLDALSTAEGVAQIVPQIIRFNPNGASGAERVASLDCIRRAMHSTPAWRLTYPASFDALPAVVEQVLPLGLR